MNLAQLKVPVVEHDAIVAQGIVDCLTELGHSPIGSASKDTKTAPALGTTR